MKTFDLAIVGAGAAGLSAAAVAAELGLTVVIFDDNRLPGGQYFRQLPEGFRRTGKTVFDKDGRGARLYEVFEHPNVTALPETVVWNILDDNVLAYAGADGADHVRAKVTVIAAGAHDRPVPFPGWTLPGVVTAGGQQNLIKGQRVIPGQKVVVAGNGPLVLLAAANLVRAGAELLAVAEAAPVARRALSELPGLMRAPSIVRQALDYSGAVLRSGARQLYGWTVIEARGDGEREEVVLAPIDLEGHVDRQRSRTFAADLLVTGFGLLPSTELLRIGGATLTWDGPRGGWLPARSAEFETSRSGLFAIGDGCGIGGVEIALLEGRIMGLVAAQRVGKLQSVQLRDRAHAYKARLSRYQRFRAALERLYTPPKHYLDLIRPETVLCRCEGIPASAILDRQDEGYSNINALKSATRVGMGRCQGRNCTRTMMEFIAHRAGVSPAGVALPSARPPARPVLLRHLLAAPVPPLAPPDPTIVHLPRGERVD